MPEVKLGVIGGSGLYQIAGLTDIEEIDIDTPFGKPSDIITIGTLSGKRVAFLPRHGRGHRLLPTELPVRANIYALKSLGVEWVLSISAVGSLREEIQPRDLVIPDQIIDRTRSRVNTFFGNGIVAHVGFAHPFCPSFSQLLYEIAAATGVTVHHGGTYVVMEGPQFSTIAESNLYRSWGASIIGMTALPEAKLAREAELCYATLACATDYDVWRESEDVVSIKMVLQNLQHNVAVAQEVIAGLAAQLPIERDCPCPTALQNAIITAPEAIPPQVKRALVPLISKYI